MIPYAELERAIARWKVRQAGGDAGNVGVPVEMEAGAEDPMNEVGAYSAGYGEADEGASGLIQIGDGDYEESGN